LKKNNLFRALVFYIYKTKKNAWNTLSSLTTEEDKFLTK
jgi:hypothetical protein